MKQKFFLLLALLLTLFNLKAGEGIQPIKERPKVAVVLAGGGAKGVAHISALKAIEEAGLPVDMVVGTSMGSIIGAMYCVGYSPDSMLTICASEDWMQLIMDNPDYGDESLTAKKENEKYLIRMAIDQERTMSETSRGGVIAGRNVMRFFRSLTRHLPDSIDFNELPIPFACVATNSTTGQMKVFHSGNLPQCLRASMAIPTVFTPNKIGNQVYIDGGVCNNFPVDVARQMGADIVIGVDLVTPGASEPTSAVDILLHCIDLVSQDRYNQNIQACDIYIPIDVTGYTAASFTHEAIDTLIVRGQKYSALKRPSLDSLYQQLELLVPPLRTRIGEYSFARVIHHEHHSHHGERSDNPIATLARNYKNGAVSLGGRFDNIEYASILLGLRINLDPRNHTLLNFTARLGERIDFRTDLKTRILGTQNIGIRYNFRHRDLAYDHRGKYAAQVASNYHGLDLYFDQVWRKIQYRFGLKYRMHHYRDVLVDPELDLRPDSGWERYWAYYIESEYNSLDQQYFPNSGQQVLLTANVISDNFYEYEGHTLFPIVNFYYQAALQAGQHLTFLPHVQARVILSGDASRPWAQANVVGGLSRGMQVSHQLTMAGIPYMEIIPGDGVGIVGLTARRHLFNTHYVSLTGDVATMTNKITNAFDAESITWGIQAGYSIKTPAGPVSLDFHWNEHTEKFNITFNAGYYF